MVMFMEASKIVAQNISGINLKQDEKISGGQ